MTILFPCVHFADAKKVHAALEISAMIFSFVSMLSGISDKDADCVVPSVGQGDDTDVIDPAGDAVYDG